MLSSRTVLLASACLAAHLNVATAQLVPACYANSNFPGALRPVANEAECRKQCAGSTFAAIQVRLVGTTVNGLCRCGDLPPAGVQGGVCATPCSSGGVCGGAGVEAILDIVIGEALLARTNSTVPALVMANATVPGGVAPLSTPTAVRLARRPVVPTDPTVGAGTTPKQVRQVPAETSDGLPPSLLITGAIILGTILLVPFVVVSCLRYQRRRVNAVKPGDAPYNSTAKRLRPLSSTMFLDEPPAFPEMRGSPGSLISPGIAPYRARPNFGQPPSPGTLSMGPGGYVVPPNTFSVRPDSELSSFSSRSSQHLPDGYLAAPQATAFNYGVAPQAPMIGNGPMMGSNPITWNNFNGYDEVSPKGAQSQVYIGGGNSLSVVPQLAFDVDYGSFDGVVPPSGRESETYIAAPGQEEETDRHSALS